MDKKIMDIITELGITYENFKNTITDERLLKRLTAAYYELLDVAETNGSDYETFRSRCDKKKLFDEFHEIARLCGKEFHESV